MVLNVDRIDADHTPHICIRSIEPATYWIPVSRTSNQATGPGCNSFLDQPIKQVVEIGNKPTDLSANRSWLFHISGRSYLYV